MPSFREKSHATNISLYPTMFPSTAWWNYELSFMYRYCILDIILLELVFPFLLVTSSWLEGSHQWCCCNHHIVIHLELLPLVLWKKSHPSFIVGNYVCDLSYKSNVVVWLETFHKEYLYWKILMHDHATTLANTTFIHISLKLSRCLPSLPGQHWDCALIQYVSKEVSF